MAGNQVNSRNSSDSLEIKTNPILVTAVTLDKSKEIVKENDVITLKPTITPANATFKDVKWTCSDPTVAKISSTTTASGVAIDVTGNSGGRATITATSTDGTELSASFTIVVDGGYVNYPVDLGITSAENTLVNGGKPQTDWRKFYEDGTYTYLIATDYLPTSKMPTAAIPNNDGKYNGWWASASAGAIPSWEYKDRFMFNGLTSVTTTSNDNYKAVSHLLETNLWSKFVDRRYADACIGGPTLEMMCASWNEKYPSEPLYFGINNVGYTAGTTQAGLTSGEIDNIENYSAWKEGNTLYFPHNKEGNVSAWNDCCGYWISSPSTNYQGVTGNGMWRISYRYAINCNTSTSKVTGVRPVVCLKAGVDMEMDDNGIWQLHATPVTSISLSPSEAQTKVVGDTFTITPTISPSNATDKNVKWTSSNQSVATVDANGNVTCKDKGTTIITATAVDGSEASASIELTVTPIGDYVNYPIDLGIVSAGNAFEDGTKPKTDWRIFYQDSTYTYLIASDYIPKSKFPEGVFTGTNGNYVGYWPTTPNGTTPSWEYKDRFMFNGLTSVTTSNANYKATTYLLNTNLWSSFVNNTYADVAIGGPTIEMYCASWNACNPSESLYFGVNSTGYTIGTSSNNLSTEINWPGGEDKHKTLYGTHNGWYACGGSTICGCWLASPASYSTSSVSAAGLGAVGHAYLHYNLHYTGTYVGVRPVVCLKSTVNMTKDSNGVWQLSN